MNEYDETAVLQWYVLNYYRHLASDQESLALKALIAEEKAAASGKQAAKVFRERWGIESDPSVREALSQGEEAFKQALVRRLLREHAGEIHINRCPQCSRIVQTPRARICRWCFHDWH